jgi:hypothetical protein
MIYKQIENGMMTRRELSSASTMTKTELRIVSTTVVNVARYEKSVDMTRHERRRMRKAERSVDMTTGSRTHIGRAKRTADMKIESRTRMRRVETTVDTMTTDRIGCHPNPLARKRCR